MISKGVPPSTSDPPFNLKPQADCVPSLKISTGTKKSTHSESIPSDLSLKAGNQLDNLSKLSKQTPTNSHILPGDPFCLLHALFICCCPPDTEMLGTDCLCHSRSSVAGLQGEFSEEKASVLRKRELKYPQRPGSDNKDIDRHKRLSI